MTDAGLQWAHLLRAAGDAVHGHVEELTALDSVVGDGDHGVNLAAGFVGVIARLDADQTMTAPEVLRATGNALQESMAGTAGLLLGRFFVVAGRAIEDRFDAATVATVLTTGTAEIAKRGGAKLGDRSMIDALEPAAALARELNEQGTPAAQLLAQVAAMARSQAKATASLRPRVGRAARATEEATGRPDAGASSVALILEAWANELARSTTDV